MERGWFIPSAERWRALQRYRNAVHGVRRMETELEAFEASEPLREMLRAHIAYLDHLTKESHGFTDHRLDFTTFYLTHREQRKAKHG